jgi:hypothetical protein
MPHDWLGDEPRVRSSDAVPVPDARDSRVIARPVARSTNVWRKITDPLSKRILCVLEATPDLGATALASHLTVSEAAVTYRVWTLVADELVEAQRVGHHVVYRLTSHLPCPCVGGWYSGWRSAPT